jgi:hypothetical protein
MPEAGRTVSNYTMYVFGKEKYLKTLLRSGRITAEQYEKMERFLYERFGIDSVDDFDDTPATSPIVSQPVRDAIPEATVAEIVSAPVEPAPVQAVPESAEIEIEYASLTDLARECNPGNPGGVIQLWLQNRNTIEFLKLWEQAHNPRFNLSACEDIQNRLRDNAFTLTAKHWIEQTGAIGLQSKSGRYGGTFAHPVIACEFLTGLSPAFKLLLIEMSESCGTLAGQAGGVQ